jgi:hypothetical protein
MCKSAGSSMASSDVCRYYYHRILRLYPLDYLSRLCLLDCLNRLYLLDCLNRRRYRCNNYNGNSKDTDYPR